MKLKNILFTIAATTWLFSSCSGDSIVDGPVISGGEEATISATLSINSVDTKASTNYETPDADKEKLINNYVIAVFDADGKNVVGLKAETLSKPSNEFTVEVLAKSANKSKETSISQTILTIANLTDDQLTACKDYTTYTQFQTLVAKQTGAFQSENLMKVAQQSQTLTAGTVNSFDIKLDQLVARVDVAIKFTEEDKNNGASFELKAFKVENVNTKSKVLLTNIAEVKNKETSMSSLQWNDDKNAESSFSFYTYEKLTANSPIKITITGVVRENKSDKGTTKTYTYSLNPVESTAEPICKTTGIVHGNTYQLNGLMNLSTKAVTFGVTVSNWIPVEVGAAIKDMHYLFVLEKQVVMPNITTYPIDYASDLNVKISDLKVRYEYLDNKVMKKKEFSSTNNTLSYRAAGDKTVNIQVNDGQVVVKSDLPTNLAPLTIEFTVKTTTNNLSESVVVIQYPSNYITGSGPYDLTSKWHFWSGTSANQSINIQYIFMVNVITAFGDYRIGNPVNESGYTETDEESNKMISPKFVIASQNGASQLMKQYTTYEGNTRSFTKTGERDSYGGTTNYPSAKDFCHNYSEGSYAAGTWRLPTLAELAYVRALEYEHESATGKVLAGDEYWSAQTDYAYQFTGKNVGPFEPETAHTRCVRDVY